MKKTGKDPEYIEIEYKQIRELFPGMNYIKITQNV